MFNGTLPSAYSDLNITVRVCVLCMPVIRNNAIL
jgi:hypothetical protein